VIQTCVVLTQRQRVTDRRLVPPPTWLVYTTPLFTSCFRWLRYLFFLQFTFREHLYNVCTIWGVLYYSAAFVEVEYFDDLNALIDVLAIFEHAIWLFFFAYVQKQQVAALAIDKVGPICSTVFVRALPRALPLGQEAKKVKSPWSIILLFWKVIILSL